MTIAELESAGIHVRSGTYDCLVRFVDLLAAENSRVNLTAIHTGPDVWRLHICDSLALLPLLEEFRAGQSAAAGPTDADVPGPIRLLDLGTGGGVPGIPLACAAPELDVMLLDATRKKVAAVERMLAALELTNARAVWDRAESAARKPEHHERYDVVVARAVAKLPLLLRYAAGFLRPGGAAWFFKSAAGAARERQAAEPVAAAVHLQYSREHEYRLPADSESRVILSYRKCASKPAQRSK